MPNKGKNDPILEELKKIKNLLILALYAVDVPSEEIDKAVRMGAGNIRKLFSKGKLRGVKNMKIENEK